MHAVLPFVMMTIMWMLPQLGVLLSPGAGGAPGLGASTVLVSKADAASQPATPARSRRTTGADGSEAAEQEWQIL